MNTPQNVFEQLLEELRVRIKEDLKTELHSLDEKLDWLIGAYKKFDKEQTLLGSKVSDMDERIEVLEKNGPAVVQ